MHNSPKSRVMSNLRDSLLLKLMRGQIRVKDRETNV
jgi:hypothetical protein